MEQELAYSFHLGSDKNKSKLRKAKYNKEYLKTYERKKDKSDKEDYEKLQSLLDSDARHMSRHSFGISIDAFVKSNIKKLGRRYISRLAKV